MAVENAITRVRIFHSALEASLRARFQKNESELYPYVLILVALDANSPMSTIELCRETGISRANIYERLGEMEKMGWLIRSSRPADKRKVYLSLTGEGALAASRVETVLGEWEKDVFGRLSMREFNRFFALCDKLAGFALNAPLAAYLRRKKSAGRGTGKQ